MKNAGVVGGAGLIIALIYALLGGDPGVILNGGGDDVSVSDPPPKAGQPDDAREFVSVVLADTEDVWRAVFAERSARYEEPKLVLFEGRVNSACGMATSAVGPFYCPGDRQLYLDFAFFRDLERQLGASGDFAQAYVIAHEVGHHVQNLMGVMEQVQRQKQQLADADYNRLSVNLELQADCLAGVWATKTQREKKVLEAGDVEEAIGAAAAVGDDRLQGRNSGEVVPDSFTHGTSKQRVAWFQKGFEAGEPEACDTFNVAH